jgi:hypothetical protein
MNTWKYVVEVNWIELAKNFGQWRVFLAAVKTWGVV